MTAPTCQCGRTMRLEARFRIDHEPADGPRNTLQLVELRTALEQVGAWGADVTLYYCEPCDVAEAQFAYPDEAST